MEVVEGWLWIVFDEHISRRILLEEWVEGQ
jgi:hypothetical protein